MSTSHILMTGFCFFYFINQNLHWNIWWFNWYSQDPYILAFLFSQCIPKFLKSTTRKGMQVAEGRLFLKFPRKNYKKILQSKFSSPVSKEMYGRCRISEGGFLMSHFIPRNLYFVCILGHMGEYRNMHLHINNIPRMHIATLPWAKNWTEWL